MDRGGAWVLFFSKFRLACQQSPLFPGDPVIKLDQNSDDTAREARGLGTPPQSDSNQTALIGSPRGFQLKCKLGGLVIDEKTGPGSAENCSVYRGHGSITFGAEVLVLLFSGRGGAVQTKRQSGRGTGAANSCRTFFRLDSHSPSGQWEKNQDNCFLKIE